MYKAGDIINDRYIITSLLGVGFASKVYLATDKLLQRKLVLKEFELGPRATSLARIQRETEIYGRLRHPNILAFHDLFLFKETVFLVFAYVEGKTLSHLIKEGSLTLNEIVTYAIGIADALCYIHQNKIIHRDIKPSNILISDGKPVLLDFGIAKHDISNVETDITATGQVIGTPLYMAPESVLGSDVSYKADIYSFGTVLFQLLTGSPPFKGENFAELVHKISSDPPPSLEDVNKSIPHDLAKLVNRMLTKSITERPDSSEVLNTLKNIASNKDILGANLTLQIKPVTEEIPAAKEDLLDLLKTLVVEDKELKKFVEDNKKSKPTGFFANEIARQKELSESREFYRKHLDKDYQTLLLQARISFWLWILFSVIGFFILIIGVFMLYQGKVLEGSLSLASEIIIFFIQKVFKVREDEFREKASMKNKHLEIGNIWNLAVQSIDGISQDTERKEKLSKLTDALIKIVENR